MSELQVFNNAEFGSVRSLMVNGESYFVGKDVAEILGYSNTRDALAKHVDEEDRTDGVAIRDSIGREQMPVLINESGLYSLILSSKLPSAKRFKRWVTSEVLPAIRKHGVFVMDDIVNNTDALIEALQAFKAERLQRMALEEENAVQKQQLVEIAKALAKSAKLLILDEPTAALDPVSEYEIYSSFNAIAGDKTAIYISHRLASCRFCDKIMVFDNGQIVQKGTHNSLIADTCGKYHALWHAQAQYYTTENCNS